MSHVSYLHRILKPLANDMSPEFSRVIANLRADAGLLAEIDQLRDKANHGTLSDAESVAYHEFIDAIDVVSVFQSIARQRLEATT